MEREKTTRITVLVVDDHKAFREGLARVLGEEDDIEIIGQSSDGKEAIRIAEAKRPSIMLLDISMPGMNGIEVIRQIGVASPQTAVVVLSAFCYRAYVIAAVELGVRAYLLKTQGVREIAQALRSVRSGYAVFSPEVDAMRNSTSGKRGKGTVPIAHLSNQEIRLLTLAGRGLSNKEIARETDIAERTVQTHFHNLSVKLGTQSRTQAVLRALAQGWITLDDFTTNV